MDFISRLIMGAMRLMNLHHAEHRGCLACTVKAAKQEQESVKRMMYM